MNNYSQFYQKLCEAKEKFGKDHQSSYRNMLKPINVYENKRA